MVGTQEKADETEMQEKEQGEMHRMPLLLGQTQVMVPLAQGEPLSQICLKEGRDSQGSFQSRVLPDMCLPSAPQLVHPALS